MAILKYGVDISEHNGSFGVENYKDGFVIIRLSWGTNLDKKAIENMNRCERYGVPYGVYCYSYALDTAGAEAEAKFLLEHIKGRKLQYPVYFDMEDADGYKRANGKLDGALMTAMCNKFCEVVSKAGYYAGVYASESWFNGYLKGLGNYDKWIASWGVNDGRVNRNFDGQCGMLQYTSKMNGQSLDGNVAYYDFPAIMKERGLNGYSAGSNTGGTSAPTQQPTNTPAQPNTGSQNASNGAVALNNVALYASSTATAAASKVTGTYWKWSNEVINGRVRITNAAARVGVAGQVTGWVAAAAMNGAAPTVNVSTIKAGDKVKVINNVQYTGGKFAVYYNTYDVIQAVGDRVVIGQGNVVTAAVNRVNLQKV